MSLLYGTSNLAICLVSTDRDHTIRNVTRIGQIGGVARRLNKKEARVKKLFSTEQLHPRDRFDYFHEVACKHIVGHEFPTSIEE